MVGCQPLPPATGALIRALLDVEAAEPAP